jgi:lipopolysaccharide biosynthesis glycosyltransferase
MSESQNSIHVALTFNDKYWALAYTVMRSICLSTNRRRDIVFHLCHTELSRAHGDRIDTIATEFGATQHHYDPTSSATYLAAIRHLPLSDRFPAIVYARLLLDTLLPPGIERVIYLDCDTLVRRPIEQLYEIDMAGLPIAAVHDPYHDGIKLGRDMRTKASPFDSADPYFNSGVLLIDRAALAAANIPRRIEEMAAADLLKSLYFDQDILNYIFRGRWLELNWRYNLMRPVLAHEAISPAIIHYTGHNYPWNWIPSAAYVRAYRHIMTYEVYYQYLAERSPRWLGPWIRHLHRRSMRA